MGSLASQHAKATSGESPTNHAWNSALAGWFFGPQYSKRPVYLSVDDAVLWRIVHSQGWQLASTTPAASLRSSLSTYLDQRYPFRNWVALGENWSRRAFNGPPPFVHILALTVLALTKERGPNARGGFYPPLFQLLEIDDTAESRADYRESVPRLWQLVHDWLTAHEGELGLPTARHGVGATGYVGYSLSQAVVRAADRATFLDFFAQSGYAPFDVVGPALLLARFEMWAGSHVSERVRVALNDVERRSSLGEVLRLDLAAWNGDSRDDDYRQIHRLVPRLDAKRRQLTTVLKWSGGQQPMDVDGIQVKPDDGDDRVLFPRTLELRPTDERQLLDIGGEPYQLRHSVVHVFEEDLSLWGYTEVDRATSGRPAWVVAASGAASVLKYFERQGFKSEVWQSMPQWRIFRNVPLERTNDPSVPRAVAAVLPPNGLRAELRGGLAFGSRRYDVDGAPDVFIPPSPFNLGVLLNGKEVFTVPAEREVSIRLAGLASVAGAYEVQVGDQTLRFQLAVAEDQPPVESLWHVIEPSQPALLALDTRLSVGDVGISGPQISPCVDEPLEQLAWRPSTDGMLLLGDSGDTTIVPSAPVWLREMGQTASFWTLADLSRRCTYPVKWVVRVLRGHVIVVQPGVALTGRLRDAGSIGGPSARGVRVDEGSFAAWQTYSLAHGTSLGRVRLTELPVAPHREIVLVEGVSDRLLNWCSARGAGGLDDFVATARWLDPSLPNNTAAYHHLRDLWFLGHVEVDWHARSWVVTRPCIVAPANAGGLAYFVGKRSRRMLDKIANILDESELDAAVVFATGSGRSGPLSLLIRSGGPTVIAEISRLLGIPLVQDPASSMIPLLPSLDAMIRRGRIPGGFEARRLGLELGQLTETVDLSTDPDGSYEHDTFGPHIYSICHRQAGDGVYLVDRSTAIWNLLRRERVDPILYDNSTAELTVPTKFGLPLLHQRSLIYASGLLPRLDYAQTESRYVYVNITSSLVDRLRKTLTHAFAT